MSTLDQRIEVVRAGVQAARLSVDRDTASKQTIEQMHESLLASVRADEQLAEDALKARTLFETLTEKKREVVRTKIEELVTYGIQAVFGPDYAFKIEQKTARNQVTFEYRILHTYEGSVRDSELRGYHGGGLVALVGFLLRVVMVLYSHPPRRRIIFLDETMAALDGDKRQSFAKLMTTLGSELDLQFVLITHSPEYAEEADKVYEITQTAGVSKLDLVN